MMIRTSTFLLLKLKGSLLVRSRAICSEAASCSRFEACTVADTIEVGAEEVSGVREDRERLIGHDTHKEVQVLLARPSWTQARTQASAVCADTPTAATSAKAKM
jgi:hypothetical protein